MSRWLWNIQAHFYRTYLLLLLWNRMQQWQPQLFSNFLPRHQIWFFHKKHNSPRDSPYIRPHSCLWLFPDLVKTHVIDSEILFSEDSSHFCPPCHMSNRSSVSKTLCSSCFFLKIYSCYVVCFLQGNLVDFSLCCQKISWVQTRWVLLLRPWNWWCFYAFIENRLGFSYWIWKEKDLNNPNKEA